MDLLGKDNFLNIFLIKNERKNDVEKGLNPWLPRMKQGHHPKSGVISVKQKRFEPATSDKETRSPFQKWGHLG